MELPNTGSRLDSDSRVLTEINVHDDTTESGPTVLTYVEFCVRLVDRRRHCFLSSYNLNSVVIARTRSVRIKAYFDEESWKTVERALAKIQCLGKDTIRKVIRRVKIYLFLKLRPRLLVVYVNKVVVNQEALFDWYRSHGAGIYRSGIVPKKELALKRISFEEMNLKDDEEYCCSICLENLGEQEDVKVTTRNLFSVCLEYFFMQKDATLMCTPCNHIFHDHCILEWSRVSSKCPLCRRSATYLFS